MRRPRCIFVIPFFIFSSFLFLNGINPTWCGLPAAAQSMSAVGKRHRKFSAAERSIFPNAKSGVLRKARACFVHIAARAWPPVFPTAPIAAKNYETHRFLNHTSRKFYKKAAWRLFLALCGVRLFCFLGYLWGQGNLSGLLQGKFRGHRADHGIYEGGS